MINALRLSNVNANFEAVKTSPQSTPQTSQKLLQVFKRVKVNGSVALPRYFLVVKKWQQARLSLILGSDRKGVTQ